MQALSTLLKHMIEVVSDRMVESSTKQGKTKADMEVSVRLGTCRFINIFHLIIVSQETPSDVVFLSIRNKQRWV